MSLRLLLAPLFLAAVCAAGASAQPTTEPFSFPRIGGVIDPGERRYFGLFPDLGGDDTLRVERSGPDSVRVVSVSGPYRLRISADQAGALADLVARYEALFLASGPPFASPRVSGLVQWRRPFQESGVWVTVTPRSGPEVRGVLLHADDGGLVLSPAPPPFRGFQSADGLVWVGAADVLRVRREGFWSRLDLRPGGDRERYLWETLPALRDGATFVRGLSPELEAWRRAHAGPSRPDVTGPEGWPPVWGYARLPLSRWQVSLQYSRGWIDAGSTTTHLFGLGGTVTNGWRGSKANVRGRVDYAFTRALGVGVAVERVGTDEIEGVGLDSRRFSAVAVDFTASYAVAPPQLREPLFPSVTVRAGGSVVGTRADTRLEYYWPSRDYTASAEHSERSVEVGFVAGAEAAFRLSRGASVSFGYDVAVYPWAEEGPLELDDPRVDLVIKTVDPRTFDLRRGGATVGLTVHLGGP